MPALRVLVCLTMVVGAVVSVALPVRADAPVVATVFKIHGHWVLNNGSEIRDGDELPSGEVRPKLDDGRSPDPSWTFIVLMHGTAQLVGCVRLDTSCHLPIELPRNAGGDPARHRADNVAHGFAMTRDRKRFLPNEVRSALRGGAAIGERVIAEDASTIDAAAFVDTAPNGDYRLRVRDIDRTHPPSDDVFAAFTWRGSGPVPVTVGALRRGVYEVQLLDADGSYPRTDPAWIAIVARSEYASASAQFGALSEIVRSWGPDADRFVVERFVRASLEYVADGDVAR